MQSIRPTNIHIQSRLEMDADGEDRGGEQHLSDKDDPKLCQQYRPAPD